MFDMWSCRSFKVTCRVGESLEETALNVGDRLTAGVMEGEERSFALNTLDGKRMDGGELVRLGLMFSSNTIGTTDDFL